ncbi:helix-turn-helix transcriptional regulator [Kribbella kalugense]|uniref:Putative DNA-binding transcriptional regulator YafY n=1 Tax=Kribbella kalugense TaxID=2512221 RepID=A0A4R7ZFL4_9ACTN|nr:YafY family protein [Kribbella kalugense]TDW15028.1 putative DNA-binding transcriptional regulator YafY [Kribbella kalugense]
MTRPTSRVLALLELLQSGGTRRVADLADRIGVDERTIRRYAEHLADLDIPIRSVRGRYGGYRLAPGFRMPPLMLTDDEAVAVAIGLVVGRRAGLVPESTASDSALSKLRRVLPARLADRLGALLSTSSFTAPPRSGPPTDTGVLLTIAEAARDRRAVEIDYTDRRGQRSTRTIAPYGVVGHAGHWYVATDDRTFRLDRIISASLLTATTEKAPGDDPARAVLESLATAPWAHTVSVRVLGTVDDIQRRLPLGLAVVTPLGSEVRVELRAERLDWVPALLAGLDRPFVIEEPAELRGKVADLANRLASWAEHGAGPQGRPHGTPRLRG